MPAQLPNRSPTAAHDVGCLVGVCWVVVGRAKALSGWFPLSCLHWWSPGRGTGALAANLAFPVFAPDAVRFLLGVPPVAPVGAVRARVLSPTRWLPAEVVPSFFARDGFPLLIWVSWWPLVVSWCFRVPAYLAAAQRRARGGCPEELGSYRYASLRFRTRRTRTVSSSIWNRTR